MRKRKIKKLVIGALVFASAYSNAYKAAAQVCADLKFAALAHEALFEFSSELAKSSLRLQRGESNALVTVLQVTSASGKVSTLRTSIPQGKYLGHNASVSSVLIPYVSDCEIPSDSTNFENLNFFRYNVDATKDVVVLYRSRGNGEHALFTFNLNWVDAALEPQVSITCEERDNEFDFFGYVSSIEQDYVARGMELGGVSDPANSLCEDQNTTSSDVQVTCADRTVCDSPYLSSSNEDIIMSSQDGEAVATMGDRLGILAGSLRTASAKSSGNQAKVSRKVIKPLIKIQATLPSSKKTQNIRKAVRRAIFIARIAGNSESPVALRERYVSELAEKLVVIRKYLARR